MIKGLIGGLLGFALAFILDCIGVDTYVLRFLQSYLTLELNAYHFYVLFGFIGMAAGILPW